MTATTTEKKKKKKVSQVIGARIKYEDYNRLQVMCIATDIPISVIIKHSINHFLNNSK